jgi:polysaccharide export outer membrane protein
VNWRQYRSIPIVVLLVGCATAPRAAQTASAPALGSSTAPAASAAPVVTVPADYVIGADDVLTIRFWNDDDLSGDVLVRPDGRISLKLLNDVQAGGLTPEELRVRLTEAADKFIVDPTVTVQVKTINSRRVFINGNVAKAGPYPLTAPTTVVQLISMAGGLLEYADDKNITVIRRENGRQISFKFNYNDVSKGRNLSQNIELKPGDTILVR